MSEITYAQLEDDLPSMQAENRFASVYLIFGDPFLCRLAYAKLLDALVPESKRSFNYEVFEGPDEDVMGAIESLNTYSFLADGKVVGLKDSRIFHSREDDKKLVEKAREEFDQQNLAKAASHLMRFLKSMNLSVEDVRKSEIRNELNLSETEEDDLEWMVDVADYCLKGNLRLPEGRDYARSLEQAIRKGFPKGNRLLISTEKVDRRHGLFKTIQDAGMLVDCSIPMGPRQADKKARDAILHEFVGFYLKPSGKTIQPRAYEALVEATGPDLGLLATSLEKLIDYIGDAAVIKPEDIPSVLTRTREDPIFELTGAIADRNIANALTLLDSLLSQKLVPQQIISGIAKQMRKLMAAKDFVESPQGSVWKRGMPFPAFKTHVLTAMQEYDAGVRAFVESGDIAMKPPAQAGEGARSKKKARKIDLLVAETPGNPYPIYLSVMKSDNYAKEELMRSFIVLSETEWELRSPPRLHQIILERMIMRICGKDDRG